MHARGLNAPSRPFCRALILWLLQATAASLGADLDPGKLPPPASRQVDFRRDIHPLLSARCFKCHGGHDAKSGYRLDHRAEILGETNGLPLALPGKSAASRLIH